MKTTTCDVCGKTTRENTKWATTVIEDYQLHSLTMNPIGIDSRQIDLCPDCTENALRWLNDNVKDVEEVAR